MNYCEFKEKMNLYIKNRNLSNILLLWEKMEAEVETRKELQAFSSIIRIIEVEKNMGIKGVIWQEEYSDVDALVELYYKVKYCLRRIEYEIEPVNEAELLECNISGVMLWMMTSLFTVDKKRMLLKLSKLYDEHGETEIASVLKRAGER